MAAPVLANGPKLGDAFGATLLACWEQNARPGAVLEIVERDDGFIGVGDAARYFTRAEEWGQRERWACERARGRVLDVGCGAGRHALDLQQRGIDVVALDVSPLAAEVCRRRGVRNVVTGTAAELLATNPEPFDSFLLFGNNLGLLASAHAAPDFLETLARLATPEALIIGIGTDPYQTENPIHLAYHRRNRALGRLPGQIRMRVRHLDLATDWFDYLFVSIPELEEILVGSAWRLDHHEAEGASYVALLRRSGEVNS